MITISKPESTDAESIYELLKASWYATYINDALGITKADADLNHTNEVKEKQIQSLRNRAEKQDPSDISLVAKEGEKLIGFIRFHIDTELIELFSLYVDSNYIGQGVGTRLWNEALKLLPQDKSIITDVAVYTKAVDFYKKLGFKETGETHNTERMPSSGNSIPLIKIIFKR